MSMSASKVRPSYFFIVELNVDWDKVTTNFLMRDSVYKFEIWIIDAPGKFYDRYYYTTLMSGMIFEDFNNCFISSVNVAKRQMFKFGGVTNLCSTHLLQIGYICFCNAN